MNGYLSVISLLRADGQVGLLIGGSGVNTARVFPGDPPQAAQYPLICVETFDSEPFDTKDGVSVVDNEMVKVSYMSESESTLYDLAERGRDALDGQSGTINGRDVDYIRYLGFRTFDINLTNMRLRVHEQDYEVRVKN
jgi:hypothetical protein